MSRPVSQEETARQLRAISSLSRDELIECWTSAYGHPPPKGISRPLLERAAAYHLQVAGIGGIPPDLRRQLTRLVHIDDPARQSVTRRRPAARLSPGTRLVREWNGRTYNVEVTDRGFLWNGRSWASLSAVAVAITGARWSGPRFFRL